ncbi:arsenosugar biosynthesis radical SAM (seleno)protein ArsS [Chloroflexota bacterium]
MENEKTNSFPATLEEHNLTLPPLSFTTLWVNITRLCNQSCSHCHVGASPRRTEQMDRATMDSCIEILAKNESCLNLDITGGAPELNPDFHYLVDRARKLNKRIIVRHNLTVTLDGNPQTGEDMTYLPEYFAENHIELLASLPSYEKEATDLIRGEGVFEKSIRSLRLLNEQGYGSEDGEHVLNLVYNHNGPLSPDDRKALEADFKEEMRSRHGIFFNSLYTITNMSINRFREHLEETGEEKGYLNNLMEHFSETATDGLACRSLISVDHDGRLYDCDFNQALGLQIYNEKPMTVNDFEATTLLNRKIRFGEHCFGCTSGGGSS